MDQCRLANSGRHGILMAGGNISNRVERCLIENIGITGLKVSNRLMPGVHPGAGTAHPSGHHILTNNRIRDVGQLGLYAASIGMHSSSDNEVSYSDLYNSPRYAVTLRGNASGYQSEPGLSARPSATNNHFHRLRIYEMGHDSGDMGALHAAGVNLEDGALVNTFEQITIDTVRAVPGMQDPRPPDGIFVDWPERTMHQVFRNIHVGFAHGMPFRTHGRQESVLENVSWEPGFDEGAMDYANIGVRPDYPVEFGGHSLGVLVTGKRQTTLPDNSVTLEAEVVVAPHWTVSGTATFSWSLLSGPGSVEFTAPDAAKTHIVMSRPGAYSVRVQAWVNGDQAEQTVEIFLHPYPMRDIQQTFEEWADENEIPGNQRGLSDDPFGTDMQNLAAYATGLPLDGTGLPMLHILSQEGTPVIALPWRTGISPKAYFVVESTTDLQQWRTAGGLSWQSVPLEAGRVELHGRPGDPLPEQRHFRIRFGWTD